MASPAFSLSDAISGNIANYQAGLKEQSAKTVAGEDEAKKVYEEKIAAANKEEAALDPGALKPPDLKPPPQPEATQPIQVWGSAAMWVAALGGLLTKRPLVNSLNAAGAVMKAYRDQDAAAAQQAYEVWKTETENAVKMAQFSIDAYKTALGKIDTDKKEAAAEFTATAKALGDENAAYVATHYGIDAAVRYVDAMQSHVDRMAAAQPGIDQKNAQLQLGLKVVEAGKQLRDAQQSGDPQKVAAAQAAFAAAQQEAQGFNTGMGKSTGGSFRSLPAMVANKYAQEHPDATAQDMEDFASQYGEKTKAARDFGTGAQGNVVRSLNVSVSHLETLRELGRALDNGNVTAINAAKQRFAEEFGVPAPTNFDTAKSIVADEVAKGVIGGQSAQSDRETLAAALRRSGGPQVIDGAIATFQKLLGGQLSGLRQQYQRTTGNTDFDDQFLSAATRKALEPEQGGGKTAPRQGAAPAHLRGKPIWPQGDHWVFEDGSPAK
jgi:hypothetical protein